MNYIEDNSFQIILPWPCVYETVSTTLSKKRIQIKTLERLLKKSKPIYLDDTQYREDALNKIFDNNEKGKDISSLTDEILCSILKDSHIIINAFVTYNYRDFWKINSVLYKRRIELFESEINIRNK